MAISSAFKIAAENIKVLKILPTEDELLELYALYKQATVGDCDIPKPQAFDLKAKYKWESWSRKKGMDRGTAQQDYIHYVDVLLRKYTAPDTD
ncbi:UNVERIFIED_CONTAM: hypothetical protein PYX00_010137 [Menopon gallinae]|uniref:ACB domain-containing protein n=1 Tax=Menopon gallinae TaxID=328185 RepID=A0AAW2HEX3_9NEOP